MYHLLLVIIFQAKSVSIMEFVAILALSNEKTTVDENQKTESDHESCKGWKCKLGCCQQEKSHQTIKKHTPNEKHGGSEA